MLSEKEKDCNTSKLPDQHMSEMTMNAAAVNSSSSSSPPQDNEHDDDDDDYMYDDAALKDDDTASLTSVSNHNDSARCHGAATATRLLEESIAAAAHPDAPIELVQGMAALVQKQVAAATANDAAAAGAAADATMSEDDEYEYDYDDEEAYDVDGDSELSADTEAVPPPTPMDADAHAIATPRPTPPPQPTMSTAVLSPPPPSTAAAPLSTAVPTIPVFADSGAGGLSALERTVADAAKASAFMMSQLNAGTVLDGSFAKDWSIAMQMMQAERDWQARQYQTERDAHTAAETLQQRQQEMAAQAQEQQRLASWYGMPQEEEEDGDCKMPISGTDHIKSTAHNTCAAAHDMSLFSINGRAIKLVDRIWKLYDSWAQGSIAVPSQNAIREVYDSWVQGSIAVPSQDATAAAPLQVMAPHPAGITPLKRQDLVVCAQKLLRCQLAFYRAGKPPRVDLGFHYTKASHMERIQTDGLLTKVERDAASITYSYNGSAYGDGVYTANLSTDSSTYGEVGLLVARLQGNVSHTAHKLSPESDVDTVDVPHSNFVVLKRSAQVMALLQFPGALMCSAEGKGWIYHYQQTLQRVVDDLLNDMTLLLGTTDDMDESVERLAAANPIAESSSTVGAAPPANASRRPPSLSSAWDETITYTAPPTAPHVTVNDVAQHALHLSIAASLLTGATCPICLDVLNMPGAYVVQMKACQHMAHHQCIKDMIAAVPASSLRCPTCRVLLTNLAFWGPMPTGTMRIHSVSQDCSGFAGHGSLEITYAFPNGTQATYHESPGTPYSGTTRIAYVPNVPPGQDVVRRLKFAFQHGLTFTIGTSLTTNTPHQITWASIHHKTCRRAGAYGYPDPNYFVNCNAELDALHVPPAFLLPSKEHVSL